MLVLLERGVSESVARDVATRLRMFGLAVHRTDHEGQVRLGAVGEPGGVDWAAVAAWSGSPRGEAGRSFKLAAAPSSPTTP
jgi:hypothetical protein